jgi:hypothetical protein
MGVKDKRFLDIISALVPQNILFSFVVQNREDYDKLTHNCIDLNKWPINIIQLDGPNHSFSDYRPQIGRETMQSAGFNCYALELVSAPAPVLTGNSLHFINIINFPTQLFINF